MATNEELITRIQSGICVKSNMYQLYMQNITLLKIWSKKYISIIGADDVLQECYIALHSAAYGFDAEKEYKFTTYLQKVIARHFSRILSTNTGTKIGINDKKLLMEYKILNEKEQKTNGKPLSDNKACCLLGCSAEQLEHIKNYMELIHPISLDKPLNDNTDGNVFISDVLQSDTDIIQDYEDKAMKEYALKVWEHVHNICTEAEESVITQRYKDNLTLKQTGINNGFSLERARQYEQQTIRKLRQNKEMKRIAEELYNICDVSYRYGYSSWLNNRASAVELTLELLEKATHPNVKIC